MMKSFSFFLLLITSFSFGQQAPFINEFFYRGQCIEDIKQLQTTLTDYHPSPYTYTSKVNLTKRFNQYIYDLPDSINTYQLYTDLTSLINQVRDGHLFLSSNAKMNDFEINQGHILPFSFRIFDYKLLIQSNYGDSPIEEWDIITSINGVPTTDLIYELLPLIPTDGYCNSRKLKLLEENFSLLYARKYGLSNSYLLKTISKNNRGKQALYSIKGIKTASFIKKQQTKKPFFTEIDQGKNRAYLKIPSFNSFEIKETNIRWKSWIRSYFKEVQKKDIEHLVLDLRGNQGGNVKLMSYLLRHLMNTDFQLYETISVNNQLLNNSQGLFSKKQLRKLKRKTYTKDNAVCWNERFTEYIYSTKKRNFKGRLYVLMDGGTYSSASHAIQLLHQRNHTKFFGNETGGNGVSSNAGKTIVTTLKNSRFNLHLPLMKGIYKTEKAFSTSSGILPAVYCGNELLTELKYSDICLLNVLEEIQRNINKDK